MTGADAGQVFMPAPQTGSPMTYAIDGTQYIAVAVSGPGFAGELLVYRLGQSVDRPMGQWANRPMGQ